MFSDSQAREAHVTSSKGTTRLHRNTRTHTRPSLSKIAGVRMRAFGQGASSNGFVYTGHTRFYLYMGVLWASVFFNLILFIPFMCAWGIIMFTLCTLCTYADMYTWVYFALIFLINIFYVRGVFLFLIFFLFTLYTLWYSYSGVLCVVIFFSFHILSTPYFLFIVAVTISQSSSLWSQDYLKPW